MTPPPLTKKQRFLFLVEHTFVRIPWDGELRRTAALLAESLPAEVSALEAAAAFSRWACWEAGHEDPVVLQLGLKGKAPEPWQ